MGKTYKGEVLVVLDGPSSDLEMDISKDGQPLKVDDVVNLTGLKFNFVRLLKVEFLKNVIFLDWKRNYSSNAGHYRIEFEDLVATGDVVDAARFYGSLKFRNEDYEGFEKTGGDAQPAVYR